jgi:hypothetical protein
VSEVEHAPAADVPAPEDQMTPEEAARLEELYAEFRRGLAEDGGAWPAYTGDGE